MLFNRFYQPDIDSGNWLPRDASPVGLVELRLRLHWLAILSGRVQASLAVTGGVHTALDVVRATMAGPRHADGVGAPEERAFAYADGAGRPRRVDAGARVDVAREMRGNMSLFKVPDPDAYERANYMLMLQGWRG